MVNDKIVILTGAGRGIGRALARRLAGEAATLVLVARTESELKGTLDLIADASPRSYYEVCDLSDETMVRRLVQNAEMKFGRIDALINNAAVQPPIGPFVENSISDWRRTMEINLMGPAILIRCSLPGMIKRRKGKIVNFSGGGATSPRPNFTAYGISKTAIVRLTETLAAELAPHHIDINAVAPGAINTRMLQEVLDAGKSAEHEYPDAVRRKADGGDDPMMAADLVAFLISEKSDGITGKLISAKWDPWREQAFQDLLRSDRDVATLRRIDLKTFYKKS
jgi:3-oxoacyl-[acyl-carrier protein] reductase